MNMITADGQLEMFPETVLLPMKEVPTFLTETLGGDLVTLDEAIELATQGTAGFRRIRGRWYLDRKKFLAGCI